jgi:hypothetical protein
MTDVNQDLEVFPNHDGENLLYLCPAERPASKPMYEVDIIAR